MRQLLALLLLVAPVVAELTAANVALLVNPTDPDSERVAAHYQQLRGIPDEHVFRLELPAGDVLPRKVYDEQLVPALREWLAGPERLGVRCLLLVYGMPLKVGQRTPTPEQRAEGETIKPEYDAIEKAWKEKSDRLKELRGKQTQTAEERAEAQQLQQDLNGMRERRGQLRAQFGRVAGRETLASLDSELSLLWWPKYDTYRWVFNALNFTVPTDEQAKAPPTMLTARLDGPTPEIAMRLVTDAVAAEQQGLTGKVYVDARGIRLQTERPDWYGYGGYDESLRDLANVLKEKTDLEVVLNDQKELFQPGDCPDAMLYCGWYKLAHYVDAFDWVPGAVAYHIASSEATTLKQPNSEVWCKKMLEDGVAATLGPVSEPYTVGFPKPYEFFVTLLCGKYTLVETYYRTLLLNSWMTTLIGDPLYNPFKLHPKLTEDLLRTSPPGAPAIRSKESGE